MKVLAPVATLAVAAAGCAAAGGGDPRRLTAGPGTSAALVIETSQARHDLPAIEALAAASARPREHVEVVDLAAGGKVLAASVSPPPPAMTAPAGPIQPAGQTTHFEKLTYQHRLTGYRIQIAGDRQVLARKLAGLMHAWSSSLIPGLSRAVPGAGSAASPRPDLSAATAFFTSLQQAGNDLGTRRVIVLFATRLLSDEALRAGPASLAGITVVIAGFRGDRAEELEWQAALLRAGAARAVILVAGAAAGLAPVVRQALAGHTGPAPASLRFRPGEARLQPGSRALLASLAATLTATDPRAQVSILAFGDRSGPLGRESLLSWRRAGAVRAFLMAHGVATSRLFAAGYGNEMTDPGGGLGSVGPAYGQAFVVVNPL